jgi:hypothetical protein
MIRTLTNEWRRFRFATLLLATYAYFYQGADPNQHSRIFLTNALLRGSVDITRDHGYTVDKSFFHNRFLSDKAPGLSFLAVPIRVVMRLLDRIAGASDGVMNERARMHFMTIVLCGLAGVASTLLLGRVVERYGATSREKMLVMVGYGLGTLVFPFSTVLFAHQLAALLVLLGFEIARGRPSDGGLALRKRAALFGFVGSLAIISEYPTGIIVGIVAIALVLTHRAKWRDVVVWGALGAAPILALHSFYLYEAFGSPLSMPYGHVFEPLFRVHHDQGLLGVNPPTLGAMYGVTVSKYRGLLFLCPHLVLAIFGFAYWLRDKNDRVDLRIVTAIILAYFCFNASYYAWDGGGSTGPRHFIPALAFLSIPFFFFIRRSRVHFWLGAALTCVSVFFMFASTAVLVHQAEGEVMRSSPLYDVVVTDFFRGDLALNAQDVRTLGPRFDASYNLGMFAGLHGLASLVPLLLAWVLAYSVDGVRWATHHAPRPA